MVRGIKILPHCSFLKEILTDQELQGVSVVKYIRNLAVLNKGKSLILSTLRSHLVFERLAISPLKISSIILFLCYPYYRNICTCEHRITWGILITKRQHSPVVKNTGSGWRWMAAFKPCGTKQMTSFLSFNICKTGKPHWSATKIKLVNIKQHLAQIGAM